MAFQTPPTIFILLSLLTTTTTTTSSPYLSPTTLHQNYQNMVSTFKIFIYTPNKPFTFQTPPSSNFYKFLLNSNFVTQDPEEAHLFFLPFSQPTSTRALGRLVKDVRTHLPYWNRTLGADHFFISSTGIDHSSDRNVVELKKNAVQISTFPTTSENFIPHKDVSLPPFNPDLLTLPHVPGNDTTTFLGYLKWDGQTEPALVNELKGDVDFMIESELLDHVEGVGSIRKRSSTSFSFPESRKSKFCLFFYSGDVARMVELMGSGCVPVVIVDRPIQDLPLMDVLRWSEMGLVIGTRGGGRGLKRVLLGVGEERYEKMRELCVEASRHLVWNAEPQPMDAFHMVMYQLWLRRHTIRYARRNWV
ncbi:hypothetical protein Leryth_020518 [Lithospermum erythrorhizon]|nr:hypothetical protein Leryth_020518 [Lithospermum erythrorhizon]